MSWTFDQASALIRELEPIAHRLGYNLALYGSVMKQGRGRDLDLIALSWRPDASHHDTLCMALERALGRLGHYSFYDGADGSRSFQLRTRDDELIDLKVLRLNDSTWTTPLPFAGERIW